MWIRYVYNAWSTSLNYTDSKPGNDVGDDDDVDDDQKQLENTQDTKFSCYVFVW